jgi:hypothetical protein
MAYTLEQYYDTGDDSYSNVRGANWVAQTFTTSGAFTITKVSLLAYRVDSPGTVVVSIRATNNGYPYGADLCSGSFNGNDLTTDTAGEWAEAIFSSPAALSASTQYAIIVRAVDAGAAFVRWRRDYSSPMYSGGLLLASTNSGSSFTAYSSGDQMFRTYSGSDVTAVEMSLAGGFTGGDQLCWGRTSRACQSPEALRRRARLLLLGSLLFCLGCGNYDTKQYVVAFGNNQVWYCEV